LGGKGSGKSSRADSLSRKSYTVNKRNDVSEKKKQPKKWPMRIHKEASMKAKSAASVNCFKKEQERG